MSNPVTLRRIRPDDEFFLYQVYASTREEELAPLGWNGSQKTAFLQMQFNAQHQAYQADYPDADFLIIQAGDRPVGRIYVQRGESEILIIDLAVLPQHQTGIGTAVLRDVLAEADRLGKPVRGH